MEEEGKIDLEKSPYLIPGSILVAGLIIAFAVFYSGGQGPGAAPKPAATDQTAVAGEALQLLEAGEDDFVLGNPSAPVTFVEFGDFQCPFCGRFYKEVEKPLLEKYVKTGQVKFIYRDFAFLGQESFDSAVAARCAGEQNKFWEYHNYLFEHQDGENRGAFSPNNLKNFAEILGLNGGEFNKCLDSNKHLADVQKETELARQLGVTGTPSSFINGKNVSGALPFSSFEVIVQDALNP